MAERGGVEILPSARLSRGDPANVSLLRLGSHTGTHHPTHRTLLEAGVVIVEGLDLSGVEAGEYTFVCLPLKILGGDGAPARAVLIERAT